MNIDFPFHFDRLGRTASLGDAGDDDHIRDMIEELLFTNPGERVNRPDFGSGLLQLVFAPNSPELAATLQFTIQGALQRWLGDVIDLKGLEVTSVDSTLTVVVQYVVRQTGQAQVETFTRSSV
jgi:phage baseplate assembly protein W